MYQGDRFHQSTSLLNQSISSQTLPSITGADRKDLTQSVSNLNQLVECDLKKLDQMTQMKYRNLDEIKKTNLVQIMSDVKKDLHRVQL